MDQSTQPEAGGGDVTRLLRAAADGHDAMGELLPLVYDELRRLSQSHLRGESPGHTLGATALVHEAYLRLVRQDSVGFRTRGEFFAAASVAMRRILVEHARARGRLKRGGGAARERLDDMVGEFEARAGDLVALDDALARLAEMDPRKAQLVNLRFFGGMTLPDVAEYLDCSLRTAEREWMVTRAWLRAELDRRRD